MEIKIKLQKKKLLQTKIPIPKINEMPLDLLFALSDNVPSEHSELLTYILAQLKKYGANEKTISLWQKIVETCLQPFYKTPESLMDVFKNPSILKYIYLNDEEAIKEKTLVFLNIILSNKVLTDAQHIATIAEPYLDTIGAFRIISFLLEGKEAAMQQGFKLLVDHINTCLLEDKFKRKYGLVDILRLIEVFLINENILAKFPWSKIVHLITKAFF